MDKKPLISKWLAVGIILLFVGTCFIPAMAQTIEMTQSASRVNWLYVGGSGPGNYTKIQDAIDNASNGDTVFVYDDSSPYYENVSISKSINLIGEDKNTTIVDGSKIRYIVYVLANWVTIRGFSIQNSGSSQYTNAGIRIYSSYNTILDNIIENNSLGVFLLSGSNTILGNIIRNNNVGISCEYGSSTLTGNIISYNDVHGISISSNGNSISANTITENKGTAIFMYDCQSNNISGNNITYNNDGIFIGIDCVLNNVFHNTMTNNGYAGIHLMSAHNNVVGNIVTKNALFGISTGGSWNNISGNIISYHDQCGISLDGGNHTLSGNILINNRCGIRGFGQPTNRIIHNIIADNTIMNSSEDGILLFNSDSNTIFNNIILHSRHNGIYLDHSYRCIITRNNISNNRKGIYFSYLNSNNITRNTISKNIQGVVFFSATNNTIFQNNFLSNLRDAFFKKYNENIWEQNFWDKPRIIPKLIYGRIGGCQEYAR